MTKRVANVADLANLLKPVPDPEDKKRIPLLMKCEFDGDRKAKNAKPPYLVVLDVDHPALDPVDAAMALLEAGVPNLVYTTYSHTEEEPRYRIVTPIIVDDRDAYQHIATALFSIIGVSGKDVSTETWAIHSGFYVPVAKPQAWWCNLLSTPDLPEMTWEPPSLPFVEGSEGGEDEEEGRVCGNLQPSSSSAPLPTTPPIEPLDPERAESALGAIPCDELDYQQWIDLGMALESTGHEDAFSLWDAWSRTDSARYDSTLLYEKWQGFSGDQGGITIATLFRVATDHGWVPPRDTAFDDFADLTDEDHADAARTDNGSPLTIGINGLEQSIDELNIDHSLVILGSDARVIRTDDRDDSLSEMKVRTFKDLYVNRRFAALSAAGTPTTVNLGDEWMKSPRRRTYHKAAFRPSGDVYDDTFNYWQGWQWRDVTMPSDAIQSKCGVILDHVKEVICSGNQDHYDWVIAWMAQLVQEPGTKPGTAVILRSGEGTGKGALGTTLHKMCGAYGMYVSQARHLTGNFNDHLKRCVFLFADEIDFGTKKKGQASGVLKSLITEPQFLVESKGIDARQQENYVRVFMCSNQAFVVPAGPSARRYTVLDVSEHRVGQLQVYFRDLWKQVNGDGPKALFCYLKDLDRGSLPDPGQPLRTGALMDQKLMGLDDFELWWYTRLAEGRVGDGNGCVGSDFDEDSPWPKTILCTELVNEFLRSLPGYDKEGRSISTFIGAKLKKICKGIRTSRIRTDGEQVRVYKLPSLDKAREAFDVGFLNGEIDWDGDA